VIKYLQAANVLVTLKIRITSMSGWVYVISNKAMPELVKIGYTMKTPDQRAKELSSTGSPFPYNVEYAVLVRNPRLLERTLHSHFSNNCSGKEWFKMKTVEIAAFIKNSPNLVIEKEDKRYLSESEMSAEKIKIQRQEQEKRRQDRERERKYEAGMQKERERAAHQKTREKAIWNDVFFGMFCGGVLGLFGGLAGVFFGVCAGGLFMLFTYDSKVGSIKPYDKK